MNGWADRTICAMTAACEESDSGARRCIIHSIFNRASLDPARYGRTPASVCLKRYQYSEWLSDPADNANLERVAALSVNNSEVFDVISTYDLVASGKDPDPTNGATHFFADSITPPSWAKGATYCGKWGSTLFFKDVK